VLTGAGDPDKRVVETAYEQVEHSYYQPVDAQLLVDGETKALNCLITDCIKRPARSDTDRSRRDTRPDRPCTISR